MSDLDPPFPFDDEMVEEIDASDPQANGCTGCGCLGPTWATILVATMIAFVYALTKRLR